MREFEKGHKPRGTGGKLPGAGRPPTWFHQVCREELAKDRYKAVLKIGEIARGEARFEKVFNERGQIIRAEVGPSANDVILAAEFLRDSGFGKPTQALEHTGKDGGEIKIIINDYGITNPL